MPTSIATTGTVATHPTSMPSTRGGISKNIPPLRNDLIGPFYVPMYYIYIFTHITYISDFHYLHHLMVLLARQLYRLSARSSKLMCGNIEAIGSMSL